MKFKRANAIQKGECNSPLQYGQIAFAPFTWRKMIMLSKLTSNYIYGLTLNVYICIWGFLQLLCSDFNPYLKNLEFREFIKVPI